MTRNGCVEATDSGRTAAEYLRALWPHEVEVVELETVADSLRAAFRDCDAVVAFLATGATVRILAPLLGHKTTDAPVVCVDEGRRFAIALLGGHYGANDLARRVAAAIGGEPVISNARDTEGIRPLPPLLGKRIVVGVGASRGVTAAEVLETVDAALAEAGLPSTGVATLATADLKADEPGIREAARLRGWPLVCHPAAELAEVEVPNPSEIVRAAAGTPSVAEAAALYFGPGRAPGRLLVHKRKSAREYPMATAAVAEHADRERGRLAVIGLGPGARDLTAPRALAELRDAEIVVGLDQYVDQIRDVLAPGVRIEATGLGAEEQRARSAVDLARAGHRVALIGSGDAGVYAMGDRRGLRSRHHGRDHGLERARRPARPRPLLDLAVRSAHAVARDRAAGTGGGRGRFRRQLLQPEVRQAGLAAAQGPRAPRRAPAPDDADRLGARRRAPRRDARTDDARRVRPGVHRYVHDRDRRLLAVADRRRTLRHPTGLPVGRMSTDLIAEIGACQGCGGCLLTCPEHAIRPDGGRLFVLAAQCTGCGQCQEVCPVDVIEMKARQ